MERGKIRVTFEAPKSLVSAIEAKAEAEYRSVSSVIRQAVAESLKTNEARAGKPGA